MYDPLDKGDKYEQSFMLDSDYGNFIGGGDSEPFIPDSAALTPDETDARPSAPPRCAPHGLTEVWRAPPPNVLLTSSTP